MFRARCENPENVSYPGQKSSDRVCRVKNEHPLKMEEFVGSLGRVNGGGRGGRPPDIFQFIYVPQLIRKMGPS